jgi:uncharacterized protein YjbJ (UPF0337 family)
MQALLQKFDARARNALRMGGPCPGGDRFCCFRNILSRVEEEQRQIRRGAGIGLGNRKEDIHMNWDQTEGKWKQLRGSLKQKWGKLTDDDLTVIAGSRDKLVGKMQERYGIAKEEAQKRADEWLQSSVSEEPQQPHDKTQTGRP